MYLLRVALTGGLLCPGFLFSMHQFRLFARTMTYGYRKISVGQCGRNHPRTPNAKTIGKAQSAVGIGLAAVMPANADINKYGENAQAIFNRSKEREQVSDELNVQPKKETETEIEKPYSLPKVKKPWFVHKEPELCSAVRTNNAQAVKKLLEAGADPNQYCGACANTPLFDAQSVEIAGLLIAFGTKVNTRCSRSDDTALHHAMWDTREAQVAQILLQNGVDIHAVNEGSLTALHELARDCQSYQDKEEFMKKKAELLFKAGISLTAKTRGATTARNIALQYEKYGACKLLVQLIDDEQAKQNRKA